MSKRWIILTCVIVFGALLYSLSAIFLPFLLGFIGAYALNPLVTYFENKKVPRALAAFVCIMVLVGLIALFLTVMIPYMHQELLRVYKNIPKLTQVFLEYASPFIERLSHDYGLPTLTEVKTRISANIGEIANFFVRFLLNMLSSGMVLANVLSLLVLVPIVMFYFLKDWPQFLHQSLRLIPRPYVGRTIAYAQRVHHTLGAYVSCQGLICLALMCVYSVALFAIHLPNAILLGVLSGLVAFIPYLGAFLGVMMSVAVGLIYFQGWWQIIGILVIFGVVNVIEGNIITPKFLGQKVGLHPVWIIFSLLAAGTWFGFMGILVAVPVSAVIGTLMRIAMEEYFKSGVYMHASSDYIPHTAPLPAQSALEASTQPIKSP